MARSVVSPSLHLLRELQFAWQIDWRGTDSGMSISGNSAWVVNAKPRWVGEMKLVLPEYLVGQWQAVIAQMQGRLGIIRLPMLNAAVFDNRDDMAHGVKFSNDEYLTTGNGVRYVPSVIASQDAPRGAGVVRISTDTFPPAEGQIMSHSGNPFQVTYVTDLGAGEYEIGVQMPLRSAISAGDEIRCVGVGYFELADATQGQVSYGLNRLLVPTLKVQEVLNYG